MTWLFGFLLYLSFFAYKGDFWIPGSVAARSDKLSLRWWALMMTIELRVSRNLCRFGCGICCAAKLKSPMLVLYLETWPCQRLGIHALFRKKAKENSPIQSVKDN